MKGPNGTVIKRQYCAYDVASKKIALCTCIKRCVLGPFAFPARVGHVQWFAIDEHLTRAIGTRAVVSTANAANVLTVWPIRRKTWRKKVVRNDYLWSGIYIGQHEMCAFVVWLGPRLRARRCAWLCICIGRICVHDTRSCDNTRVLVCTCVRTLQTCGSTDAHSTNAPESAGKWRIVAGKRREKVVGGRDVWMLGTNHAVGGRLKRNEINNNNTRDSRTESQSEED